MFHEKIYLSLVLLLLLVKFVSGFRLELNEVKPHSSPWSSAPCATTIVHRNYFFCLYQQNKSSESKVKFRQASNHCKRVLEAAKLAYTNKTKESITSQFFLHSTDQRCCLLHLIKQSYLLKTFLRTLITMT